MTLGEWRGIAVALMVCCAGPASAQTWETVGRPTTGPAQIYGGAANGCIAGAVQLPLDGPGYQAVRVSRNRYWGHPDTVAFVVNYAAQLSARGFPSVYVGDMGQPRGGRMPFGHASHQNGLDVDIWFNLRPKSALPAVQREQIETPLLVRNRSIDRAEFDRRHVEMLRIAATQPNVERIFVNFVIKRELCNIVTGDRSWLRRIRPWYGHDEHFHVRMACPASSPNCVRQPALPAGDGCDELDWWFRPPPPQPAVAAPARPRTRPPPPPQCAAVLRDIVPAALTR